MAHNKSRTVDTLAGVPYVFPVPHLRNAVSAADRIALDALIAKASPVVRGALGSMFNRGLRVKSAPWVGRIHGAADGDEAVIVVTVNGDPYAERLEQEERRLVADLGDALRHAGLYVGGVVVGDHRQVWIRGGKVHHGE